MESQIKKILIIRLGAIGDVVHSTVIADSVRNKYPDSEIHFMTEKSISPLLQYHKNIAKVWSFDSKKKNNFFYLFILGIILRREKFDLVVNLTNAFRNQFLVFLSGAKKTAIRAKVGANAVEMFHNSMMEHMPELQIPEKLCLNFSQDLKDKIQEKIKDFQKPLVAINPGGANDGERQGRIWPIDSWAVLGDELVQKYGATVMIVGSKAEKDYHKKLSSIKNAVMFTGELALDENAALLAQCDLVISGDSGPAHIASAVGVNVISLLGSLNCHPYGDKVFVLSAKNAPCKFCAQKQCKKLSQGEVYTPCMRAIKPLDVLELIEENKLLGCHSKL